MEVSTLEQVERLLDVVEAAHVMRVSPYTVRSWIRSGRLNATKLGRLVRVEPREIQRLICSVSVRLPPSGQRCN
jgi:excisionase family DNA binding protein